jgi:hypothetical protein
MVGRVLGQSRIGDPRIQSLKVKSKSDKQFAANLQLNWRVWDSPLDLEFGVF